MDWVYKLVVMVFALSAIACASTNNVEPPTPLTSFEPSARVVSVWTSRISSQVNLSGHKLVPYVGADKIFVVDNKGLLIAFNRVTGNEQWRKQLDRDISGAIASDGQQLYFGTLNGELLAVDAATGEPRWRSPMTTEIIALPSAANGNVVARSIDGRVSLFSASDGSELWTYSRNVPTLTVRGNSRPVLLPQAVLLGLDSGKLLALNVLNGNPFWEVTLSESSGRSEIERLSDVDADVVVDRGSIFAAAYRGKLAKINPQRGQIEWARELSSIVGFRIKEDAIFVSDADSNVWAIDRNTGASLWKQEKLRARNLTAPVPVGDYIMVGDLEGYVHWLSRVDGRMIARKRIDRSRILFATAISDDTLIVQTEYGLLAALQITRDD